MKDYTSKTKEYLSGRLNVLEDDQKEHMERTERIDDRLINLGDTVDEMHTEISEVSQSDHLVSLIFHFEGQYSRSASQGSVGRNSRCSEV